MHMWRDNFVSVSSCLLRCKPMDVVSMLNELYTKFDSFIDKHQVYKVSREIPSPNIPLAIPYIGLQLA